MTLTPQSPRVMLRSVGKLVSYRLATMLVFVLLCVFCGSAAQLIFGIRMDID